MNLRRRLNNLPIPRKITLLLLMPCLAVMILAVGVLLAFQARSFREGHARELSALASVVAGNASASVTFRDAVAASEILGSLASVPHVSSALIVLPGGTIFAHYRDSIHAPRIASEPAYLRDGRDALQIQPILLEGQHIATLNIRSDYHSIEAALTRITLWILAGLVAVGTTVAALVSAWIQRLVSGPILRLTHTARYIADNNDYSVRAAPDSSAEVGFLTRTFNQMLTRIQDQETALVTSQKKFESILNSLGGVVWEADAATWTVSFVSRPFETIFRYQVQEWLKDRDFWMSIVHPGDRQRVLEVSRRAVREGKSFVQEYRVRTGDGRQAWVRESVSVELEFDTPSRLRGLIVDVTEQKAAAEQLDRLNRRLLEVSRMAGMAEVATGVLHNVGNVLNSVSVSANVLGDRLKKTRVGNLSRAAAMLREHDADLPAFLTTHPQGRVLPEYFQRIAALLESEHREMTSEVGLLAQNIDHIKEIVARQQNYAKVSGVFEQIEPTELVEDTLRINGSAFERHRIEIIRDFAPNLPRVVVDRHKVLQILVNLTRNAKQAIDAARSEGKSLVFRIELTTDGMIAIRIRDNGVGISPENLTRIFQHGFTTKKDGHGFGLHSGANAAREMGGRLSARSDGPGQGAEFTLELPTAPNLPAPTPPSPVRRPEVPASDLTIITTATLT